MIDGLIKRNRALVRKALIDSQCAEVALDNSVIDEAVSYFERLTDHAIVGESLKQRFATGITKQKTAQGDEMGGYETYRKGAVGEQIDQGLIEKLTSGTGARIISSLANLFTSETQVWSYVGEDGESNSNAEQAEELIASHREHGAFSTAMVNADKLSNAINGSFLYMSMRGDTLKYHVLSPTCLAAIFHASITDSGEERAVDYSELEDATAVVIKLSDLVEADPTKQQYLAIFGRSEVYPYGRHVTYRATTWDSIPDVDSTDAIDYRLPSGELANPLSYLAAQNPDESIVEYPIAKLDGGLTLVTNAIVSTSSSLYENCMEFDVAYSRLLKDALNAARGKDVITNDFGAPLPRSLDGSVALSKGQTLAVMGQPASNAQGAMEVLENCIVSVAGGSNVPGYMVIQGPTMLGDISGVALMIRTEPLISFRDFRIKLNAPHVSRIWGIESGLLRVHLGDAVSYLAGVKQIWDAGSYKIPEDAAIKTDRLTKAETAGYIDFVEAVKKYHNFATDADAEALIKKYEDRADEFSSPGKQQEAQQQAQPPVRQAQPVGLTFGR